MHSMPWLLIFFTASTLALPVPARSPMREAVRRECRSSEPCPDIWVGLSSFFGRPGPPSNILSLACFLSRGSMARAASMRSTSDRFLLESWCSRIQPLHREPNHGVDFALGRGPGRDLEAHGEHGKGHALGADHLPPCLALARAEAPQPFTARCSLSPYGRGPGDRRDSGPWEGGCVGEYTLGECPMA